MNQIIVVILALLCARASFAGGFGVTFHCADATGRHEKLIGDVAALLREYGVAADDYGVERDDQAVTWSSLLPLGNTREIAAALKIPDEFVKLTFGKHHRWVKTVNKKEIAVALLMNGRNTAFEGCAADDLRTHVELRQLIAAWAEDVDWDWPDQDDRQRLNRAYWHQKTLAPRNGHILLAIGEPFFASYKYTFGCRTGTRIVYSNAVLNYYNERRNDQVATANLLKRIDHSPNALTAVEENFLTTTDAVSTDNIIPGDWIYINNTDPISHAHDGYEGSNAVYLGRNRFDDYYNDNDHSYTFEEKLDEVWQWRHFRWSSRHGAHRRERDPSAVQKLSADDYRKLSLPPEQGGLLSPTRTSVRTDIGRLATF